MDFGFSQEQEMLRAVARSISCSWLNPKSISR